MRQVVLDTETTGLLTQEGHRIIEIGCIELVNRKVTGKRLHHYINPQKEIDEEAFSVHGLSNEFLSSKPLFAEIANELIDFISTAELIIHNAPFDLGFIHYELSLINKNWQPLTERCRIIDTLILARQLHVGQRNGLDALCKRYQIDNSKRELHGALLDAHLLAQVYLAMTGGQGSLFDALETVEMDTAKTTTQNNQDFLKRNLLILEANDEERTAHLNRLEQMAADGKCLWAEFEEA